MVSLHKGIKKAFVSYWSIFRLIFVIFFLYLVGDAFYRLDGFRHYASVKEFPAAVALVSIFWALLAAFLALVVQFVSSVISMINRTLLMILARLSGNKSEAWIGRIDRMGQLFSIIQKRIDPLVWLFGLWLLISVPLVAYNTLEKEVDKEVSQKHVQIPSSNEKSPNILLVTFDALRTRSMSVYGYHLPTTPFMSEWAKSASVFTKTKASSLNTFQTTPSIVTGKRVWSNQIYHEHGVSQNLNSGESLTAEMKKRGYYTILLGANHIVDAKKMGIDESVDVAVPYIDLIESPLLLGFNYGKLNVMLYKLFKNKIRMYDWIVRQDFIVAKILYAFGLDRDFSVHPFPPEKAFNKFLEIMKNKRTGPFLAWIHLNPPHDPYLAPPPYMGMFEPSDKYRTFNSQWPDTGRESEEKLKKLEAQGAFKILRGRYDELVRYCDKEFEDFINKLEARGLLKNTIIIVSSDHGESFERGKASHGNQYLNEESLNIPLIIREPGQENGQFIHDMNEQIDIPATILDLSNISVPDWMEGRSLVPLMRGGALPAKPLFSMDLGSNRALGNDITKGTLVVWEGDYKLVNVLDDGELLLYNLKNDPDELDNLFETEPEVGRHLLAILQENLTEANERIVRGH